MSKKPDLVNMSKGMTAEEAIRERITKAKEGKEKLWTQHENAQDDSSKQMFFLLYKEIAGHVDEAEAILLLLKTDRMALAKRLRERLESDRKARWSIKPSHGETFEDWAKQQLIEDLEDQRILTIIDELESKSEMR